MPVLRLKQIDVSAARDVERMAAFANHSLALAQQRQVTLSQGADQHLSDAPFEERGAAFAVVQLGPDRQLDRVYGLQVHVVVLYF